MRSRLTAIILSLAGGASILAFAQSATARNPSSYDLITYGVVVAVSLVGGTLTAIPRYLDDDRANHPWLRLLNDLLGAVFAGIGTFWLCQSRDMDMLLTMPTVMGAAVAGVGGIKAARRVLANLRDKA
jgi:hypothetical protein